MVGAATIWQTYPQRFLAATREANVWGWQQAFHRLRLQVVDRHALHFVYAVMAGLLTLANAYHAGVSLLGTQIRVGETDAMSALSLPCSGP